MDALLLRFVALAASAGLGLTPSAAGWLLAGGGLLAGLAALGFRLRHRVNLKVWLGGLALIAPIVLFLGLAFQYDPHAISSPLIGRQAPDFTLSPIDGGAPVRLSEQQGMPTVVNFWATWCVPCKAEHRTLIAVAKRMAGKARFFGVVYQDQVANIEAWLGSQGNAYPQLLDVGSKAAIAYGVYGVPETYLIDASGRVTWKFTGPVEGRALLEELAALVKP